MPLQHAKTKLDKLIKQGKKTFSPQLMPQLIKRRFAAFAPFLGAGIRLESVDLDNGLCVTRLSYNRLTRSITQTQFSGSLYMMCEPFLKLMLMHKLGKAYYVVQHSSQIEFINEVQSDVIARIKLPTQTIVAIIDNTKNGQSCQCQIEIQISDTEQKAVAKVQQSFYIYPKEHSEYQPQNIRLF